MDNESGEWRDLRRVGTGGDANTLRKASAESDVYPLSATHLYQPISSRHSVSPIPRNTNEPSLRTTSLPLPLVFSCLAVPLASRYHEITGQVLGSDVATQRRTCSRANKSYGLTVVFCGGTSSRVRPTVTMTALIVLQPSIVM